MSLRDKHKWIKVSLKSNRGKGSSFLCAPEELEQTLENFDDPQEFETEEVWRTNAEFDQLPEFDGF